MSGPKPVKTVSSSPESPEVKAGETVQLTAQITPADAGDKTGVGESDNQEKATVDQTGLVRGVAEGSANISFTSNSGGKKATKAVTVNSAG
ncbi:Bacterial Ig-like domain (group 2) [Salmonella enterica subsp. enterica serovar Typhi]|nr:Bacterial Ig-like domain (group 2) [Salmonella enterica subsp. enterica serovar Typhi]